MSLFGAELVAARDQVLPEFLVVVDLAVEDHPDGPVFVRDGLVAGAEIDDAEAAHADAARAVGVDAFVVRAAMADDVGHGAHCVWLGLSVTQQKSCDTTHGASIVPLLR